MKKIRMIDLPGGWRFGFPKELTLEEGQTIKNWVIQNGYPKRIIDELGPIFRPDIWEQEIEE